MALGVEVVENETAQIRYQLPVPHQVINLTDLDSRQDIFLGGLRIVPRIDHT
jgi:hypothetical protein